MDRLDLLSVRYDCEMEEKAKYELAKEISSYWKVNCTDEDFYKNCIENIHKELGNCTYDEVNEIWNIIEENFLTDNRIGDIGDKGNYENHCIIKYRRDYEQYDIGFNEFYNNSTYYSVIDKQLLGEKIARMICEDFDGEIVRNDGEYDIGTICEMIDEECLNDIRIGIQSHVEEYLNNHYEE